VTSRRFKMSDFPPQYFGSELGVMICQILNRKFKQSANSPNESSSCIKRGHGQLFGTGRHHKVTKPVSISMSESTLYAVCDSGLWVQQQVYEFRAEECQTRAWVNNNQRPFPTVKGTGP
jgi:hypothetical protein